MTRFPCMLTSFFFCKGIDQYLHVYIHYYSVWCIKSFFLLNRKAVLPVQRNREFLQHCETEPFDEDYIEEVFNNMCSLRERIF